MYTRFIAIVYFQMANVDHLRDEHESNSEWRMRKEFLSRNLNNIPLDRLICLSRCFISIEVYGCTYMAEVMSEVALLTQNVSVSIMAEQRKRMAQKYALLMCVVSWYHLWDESSLVSEGFHLFLLILCSEFLKAGI